MSYLYKQQRFICQNDQEDHFSNLSNGPNNVIGINEKKFPNIQVTPSVNILTDMD